MNRLSKDLRTVPNAPASAASAPTHATSSSRRFRVAGPAWQLPREREFGTGYGKSSGYASDRRYADNWGQERFRMA